MFWTSYLLIIVMSPHNQWEAAVKGGKSLPKMRGLGHMETSRDISDVAAASIASSSLPGISENHFILLKFSQALLCNTGNYCPVNETSLSCAFSKMPGVKEIKSRLWGSPTTGIHPIIMVDPGACIPALKLMGQGRNGNKCDKGMCMEQGWQIRTKLWSQQDLPARNSAFCHAWGWMFKSLLIWHPCPN